jgi:hypothetical protein
MAERETTVSRRDAFRIALGVLGTLAGVSVIVALLAILEHYAYVRPSLSAGLSEPERYQLLAKTRADDQKVLSSYGWMDKSKGVVRLPIDVAMQKLLQEQEQGRTGK